MPGAEELYREIFHSDWNFLDVRERLRTFSPEIIALAECRRNLHTVAAALGNWHRMISAFPGSLEDLVPAFHSSIPECPVSSMVYEYKKRAGFYHDFLHRPSPRRLRTRCRRAFIDDPCSCEWNQRE